MTKGPCFCRTPPATSTRSRPEKCSGLYTTLDVALTAWIRSKKIPVNTWVFCGPGFLATTLEVVKWKSQGLNVSSPSARGKATTNASGNRSLCEATPGWWSVAQLWLSLPMDKSSETQTVRFKKKKTKMNPKNYADTQVYQICAEFFNANELFWYNYAAKMHICYWKRSAT